MGLKAIVDTLDGIPDQFHELYTERNGKFEITGIEGIKTQADIDRVQSGLVKERNDHKALKEKFAILGDRDPVEIVGILDKVPELEAAAAGKLDDNKLNEIVETRLKTKIAPIERERNQFQTRAQELEALVQGFQTKDRTRSIHDEVRRAGALAKILPEALEDALMLAERVFEIGEDGRVTAKDGVGCTPGIDPSVWFTELQNKRPHWWGSSQGTGARGSGAGSSGTNPWSAEGWNMTEQGRLYKENPAKAEQLAKSAGTKIGGPKPAAKK